MNVLSFYEEYFNNRLTLVEQHGLPFHAPSTTREARQMTEHSMDQEDFDALKRWTNQQLQKNVGIMPFLEHLGTEEGLPFAHEITDVDEEEEVLEEQHADVLEEAIEETAKRGKHWVRKDRQPSPSPADTAADTADNASIITFRPRTQSTRHRSRTPEPGNIRSTNKMAREILQDAHASERRKKRIFFQRPPDVTCHRCCDTAPLFCRGCGYAWCTECYFDREEQCVCPASLISCEMPLEAIPPSIEYDNELRDITAIEHLASDMHERFGGWQPRDRQRVRQAYFNDLRRKVKEGTSTGSSALHRALMMSNNALRDAKASFYHNKKIPTIHEHMKEQSETHPYPIRRPAILYDQSHNWTESVISAYAELCKNMLAMGCRSIPDFTKETRVLSSSHNMSFLLLNLGDIEREPRLPGRAKIPGHLLQDGTCTILPNMPYQNPANVTILCEASNFQYTTELAEKHQCIALISGQTGKENYSGSHPIACVVQADETTTIELLRDTDLEAKGKMWLLHSSTFRVIWGRMNPEKSRVIDPATGETRFLHEILPEGYEGNDETRAEVSAHVAASVTVKERIVAVNYNDIDEDKCTIPDYKPGDDTSSVSICQSCAYALFTSTATPGETHSPQARRHFSK